MACNFVNFRLTDHVVDTSTFARRLPFQLSCQISNKKKNHFTSSVCVWLWRCRWKMVCNFVDFRPTDISLTPSHSWDCSLSNLSRHISIRSEMSNCNFNSKCLHLEEYAKNTAHQLHHIIVRRQSSHPAHNTIHSIDTHTIFNIFFKKSPISCT